MPETKFREVDWDEKCAFRPLADHGFFAYSGADGDLLRKHGLAGWRVSVHGRYLIKIQQKGRKFRGRNTWKTVEQWETAPQADDEYHPELGELPMEAIEDFEESLAQLVEEGELDGYERHVYEPDGI